MENKESAMTKLNNEAATVSGYNVPAIAIRDHVAQRIMSDAIYAEKVIAEGKTLSKCYQYISDIAYEKARKMSNTDKRGGIMIGMSSEEIFALADEYYTLSDDELKIAVDYCKHMVGLDYERPYQRHGKLFYKPYRNHWEAPANGNKILDKLPRFLVTREADEMGVLYALTVDGLKWLSRQLKITIKC